MFQSFDSFEEMQEALAENERQADALVRDWQREIKPGDYVMRFDATMSVWIFTEILDPVESERKHCDMRSEEDREHMSEVEARWAPGGMNRNRRFGNHFSEMCPSGELGELHIAAVCAIIPKHVFDLATTREDLEPGERDGSYLANVFREEIIAASHGFKGEDWS